MKKKNNNVSVMDYTESHLHVCQCLVATVNDFEMSMIEYDDDLEI